MKSINLKKLATEQAHLIQGLTADLTGKNLETPQSSLNSSCLAQGKPPVVTIHNSFIASGKPVGKGGR